MKIISISVLGLLVLCLVPACGEGGASEESELRSLEVALASGTALGHSAAIALQAMAGSSACASVVSACSTFPCEGEVSISLGEACPLPLGGVASGTVRVTGTWTDETHATLISQFVDAGAGGRGLVVARATALVVSQSGDTVNLSYVGQNVEVEGEVAVAEQSTWNLEIQTAGTPADPSDDTLTITGAQQGVTGADTVQLAVTGVVVSPDCRLNPTDGRATLQEVGGTNINVQTIEFHPACDGQAENLFGGAVPLDFFQ